MSEERATYTVKEASELLGVNVKAVYDGCKLGQIPHRKFGARFVIPKVAFHRWLEETQPSSVVSYRA